jgi:SAM-dependent methyltransferase
MRFVSIKNAAVRLFLISFLVLFFELVCIRWLSSYVLYLGYFTNFVLLGCLLGIGAGALLANYKVRLINYLPILMFAFFTSILFVQPQVTPGSQNFIYFTSSIAWLQLPAYILLPIIFISITAIFTLISQELGMLLNQFAPLRAYNLNILGSLAGILCFTLLANFSFPSWIWFLGAAILLMLLLPAGRTFGRNLLLLIGLVVVIASSDFAFANLWSPYYRINMIGLRGDEHQLIRYPNVSEDVTKYGLSAKGISHQDFTPVKMNLPFYNFPYTAFNEKPHYENVLVVGAGGGNDVSFAIAHGVEHIDAVEIDPLIAKLGKMYHPEKPYSDPRVTLYLEDARLFLENTNTMYDLVVYALPDSLILAANTSNIRLESYLFTLEAFQSVKKHLKPDGLFVLYNYYRSEWLVNKITDMLDMVFGTPVYYYFVDAPDNPLVFATIFAGPKASALVQSPLPVKQAVRGDLIPATDNWPFLYLRNPTLPSYYGVSLLIILTLSGIFILLVSPKKAISSYGMPFLFMGAAFTLLETKSIVNFFLLFGSTWVVNSLVFFAILLVVLIANALAARYKFSRIWIFYVFLLIALALNYAIPLKTFLVDNFVARYVIITIFLFSPIFFANLIYSTTFRDTQRANVAFGANLLGTMLGGATEYLSLQFGYPMLVIFAGIFYLFAFYFFRRMRVETC